jgi:hypothetical protein
MRDQATTVVHRITRRSLRRKAEKSDEIEVLRLRARRLLQHDLTFPVSVQGSLFVRGDE